MIIQLPSLRLEVLRTDLLEQAQIYGACSLPAQKIVLDEDNGPDLQRSTLLHEIIHGCLENLGIHEGHDEATINGISTQLLYVLQHNPDLVIYLCDPDAPFPGDLEEEEPEEPEPEPAPPKKRKRPAKNTKKREGRTAQNRRRKARISWPSGLRVGPSKGERKRGESRS